MKRIHVVAAVISGDCIGKTDDILIAKRPDHLHQGGKWEFPGGKVEMGEPRTEALVRELEEELGISAQQFIPLIQIQHDYQDKSVFLDVWEVSEFSGEPKGMEGQQVQWVKRNALAKYEFPEANVPIVQAVQLPDRYWITPDCSTNADLPELLSTVKAKLSAGISLIQVRTKSLAAPSLLRLVEAMLPLKLAYPQARFLINGDCYQTLVDQDLWRDLFGFFSGIHLTAIQLEQSTFAQNNGSGLKGCMLAASCHDEKELQKALSFGCQFATLSPVNKTNSHPEAEPLDRDQLQRWLRKLPLPVYALGGLSDSDLLTVRQLGFQGVAGITNVGSK